jgi:hypothetical protein
VLEDEVEQTPVPPVVKSFEVSKKELIAKMVQEDLADVFVS